MIVGYDQSQMNEWKASMYNYQRQKRTKKPFGKQTSVYNEHKIVHASEIRQKQRQFDPVLQKFNDQNMEKIRSQRDQRARNNSLNNHIEKAKKHDKNYDIVNLHSYSNIEQNPEKQYEDYSKKHNKNNPIRGVYNIINNQKLPSVYYKNRQLRVKQKPNQKRVYHQRYVSPQFDIVKSQYIQNDQARQEQQRMLNNKRLKQKLQKSHTFNPIYQHYYSPSQQQNYQSQLIQSNYNHGSAFQTHLPPSYQNRLPFLHNYQQGNVPSIVKKIQQSQINRIKRHQLRYALEDQYRQRNQEHFQKAQNIIKNRVHQGKIMQHMNQQHNIISNKLLEINRSNMFEKKIQQNPYSYQFLKSGSFNIHSRNNLSAYESQNFDAKSYTSRSSVGSNKFQNRKSSIKSGGFQ